jgi:hypothetical protein
MLVGVLLLFPSPRFSHLLIVWLTSNEGIPCTSQVNAEEVSLRMKERHSQGKQRGRLRESTIEKSEPSKKSISPPVESDPNNESPFVSSDCPNLLCVQRHN